MASETGRRRGAWIAALCVSAFALWLLSAPWFRAFTQARLEHGVAEVVEAAAIPHEPDDLERLARARHVRLRELNGPVDVGPDGVADPFSRMAVEWAREELRRDLDRYDEALGPLADRPEVRAVVEGGSKRAAACTLEAHTLLLVCHDVRLGGDGRV